MREIIQDVPAEALVSMAPEELAAKMLFILRQSSDGRFHPGNIENHFWDPGYGDQPKYPQQTRDQIEVAFAEAWAWLKAQALVIPDRGINGQNGFVRLSRRARAIETEADFASFKIGRLLPKDALQSRIADRVWNAFMRGEFDVAAFLAMKGVEVAVREASGLGHELVGVKLMRAAFSPESGVLTDPAAEGGEKVGRMELFAGAMASYKNPQSHRDVNLDDPHEALEIIMFANHLIRIVDARSQAAMKNS